MPIPRINRSLSALLLASIFCAAASADPSADKYTIHENLHVGQTVTYSMTYDDAVKFTTTTGGKSTITDTDNIQSWKVKLTMLSVEDGSARRATAEVDKDSTDSSQTGDQKKVTTPCPFAGKKIILMRDSDNNLSNNFQGNAGDNDLNDLNNFVTPDEALYPDRPIAVGDTWDNSNKAFVFLGLNPGDRLSSQCRLDSVKTVDGKQIAQVTNVGAMIIHEDGNVEEDVQFSTKLQVDIAAGMIILSDQTGSSTYSTPATEATQKNGGTHFTFHCEVLPTTATAATTQP